MGRPKCECGSPFWAQPGLEKSLTWEVKVKRRLARLAEGERTDLVGLCDHGEGQAVRMECEES